MKRVFLAWMIGFVACGTSTVGPSPNKDSSVKDVGEKDVNESGTGKQEDKVPTEPDESAPKDGQELFQDAEFDEYECWACVGDAQAETEVADVQEASEACHACSDLNDASEDTGLPEVVPPCTQIPCECTDADAVFQGDCGVYDITGAFRYIGCKNGEPNYQYVDCDANPSGCMPCTYEGSFDPLYPCVVVGPWGHLPPGVGLPPNPCASGPPFPRIVIALDENVKGCVLGCCSLKDHLPKWNLPIDPKSGACIEDNGPQ